MCTADHQKAPMLSSDVMQASSSKLLGSKQAWFHAKSAEMDPVIEAKRAALAEYKHSPSNKTLKTLRVAQARSKRQQGNVPTSIGKSSVVTSRLKPTQSPSVEKRSPTRGNKWSHG